MGCINGKSSDSYKEINMKVNNLITSYSSIELYIQTQRANTYDSLLKDMDENEKEEVALLQTEVNNMENIHCDLAIFRRFRVINKYKYEMLVSKFLKNIKSCINKIQSISEINSKYLEELNSFRDTSRGMKISKKFDEKIQHLLTQICRVSFYLEIDNNCHANLTNLIESNSTFRRLSTHQQSYKSSILISDKEIEGVF